MDDLRPYPEYKHSDMPCLGKIPAHWREKRAKFLFREVDERSELGEEELLSVSHKTGVTPRSQKNVTMFKAESYVGHKLCRPDDLVINTMWAWMGALGVSRDTGIISPAYGVYRPTKQSPLLPRFTDSLLRTPDFIAEYVCRSTGIRSSRLRLYPESFLRIPIPVPSADEQAAIVRFLDHADRRIRRYIRTKQKLIKLLEEQKQAIIHQAVTRGLNPNVKLKPSGVPWLGDVPEHWELMRAKQLCSAIIDCKNRTPPHVDGGKYWVVRTTCIKKGAFERDGGYPTDEEHFDVWTQRGAPRPGDVFFTREAPAGEACMVPDVDNLCMGQRMMYFRPDPALLDSRFLLLTIYGPVVRRYIDINCSGSTVGHLRLGQVYSLPLLWCPIAEQQEIVRFVESQTAGINLTQERARSEIDLLGEYRTRLISDVVTGQLDVREAAASLPDLEEDDSPDIEEQEDVDEEEAGLEEEDVA